MATTRTLDVYCIWACLRLPTARDGYSLAELPSGMQLRTYRMHRVLVMFLPPVVVCRLIQLDSSNLLLPHMHTSLLQLLLRILLLRQITSWAKRLERKPKANNQEQQSYSSNKIPPDTRKRV